ncbi:Fc receptor-like protein 5, partial [Silurus meridionalis]
MIIHKVSKSDEGFYHCKHPERGESPRSWISVRQNQQKSSQTSEQNQRRSGAEDSQSGHKPLQTGGDVILESSVHPVTEGHPLTLRCLYRNTNLSNLRADFYKDGSVVQNQNTGEMIIHKVSKSDEGFYHCKHPERGESPRNLSQVRRSVSISGSRPSGETVGVAVGLSLSFLFIILLILMILLWFYKIKKENQQKSSQTSEQNQRRSGAEDSQSGHKPLQTGADAQLDMNDVTYAEVQLKPMKKVKRAQGR